MADIQEERGEGGSIFARRAEEVVRDKKWKRFARRARVFRHIPFVTFAWGSGSLALGIASARSDFDVIVGARAERIFSARLSTIAILSFLGWRRVRAARRGEAANKICLSHFVAPQGFCLPPPHDTYRTTLYARLVPLWGDVKELRAFWSANEAWRGAVPFPEDDIRFSAARASFFKKVVEALLAGRGGDWFEHVAKVLQIKKIERSLKKTPKGENPQIIYNDSQLMFYLDRPPLREEGSGG